mmetsp:Transcript_138/g.343  ORF Transcript_138/g.343 Transcript_138/m.343 type:complete len:93 (-) Transcript_138:2236-2514(-)
MGILVGLPDATNASESIGIEINVEEGLEEGAEVGSGFGDLVLPFVGDCDRLIDGVVGSVLVGCIEDCGVGGDVESEVCGDDVGPLLRDEVDG